MAANGFVSQQLDIKAAFLYDELEENILMCLSDSCTNSNKVVNLKRYINGLK
jgi:hypothetical protein